MCSLFVYLVIILHFALMQVTPESNKSLQSANQNWSSAAGQAHTWSLNEGSKELFRGATNGASQPNVPACKFVHLYVGNRIKRKQSKRCMACIEELSGTVSLLMSTHVLLSQHSVNV